MDRQPKSGVARGNLQPATTVRFSSALIGLTLALAAPAWAQAGTLAAVDPQVPATMELPTGLARVTPAVMKRVRGRFVAPDGSVVYFGVSMSSSWMSGGGEVNARLSLGFRPGPKPDAEVTDAKISVDHNFSDSSTGSRNRSISGDPPVNHMGRGLGQSIQVAGQGNRINNQVEVSTLTSPAPAPTSNQPLPKPRSCGHNCQVALKLADNQLGLTINNGERGVIAQLVGSGRVTQSAQIKSDFNNILNQLHVDIYRAHGASPLLDSNTLSGLLGSLAQH